MNQDLSNINWPLISILFIIELIFKGIALWRAARKNHTGWFVALLIINSAGILPIIYLLTLGKEEKTNGKN